MEDPVLVERLDGGVVIVTLNRPAQRNAMNLALSRKLASTFRDLERDDTVAAVVLAANGKAFCSGVDLTSPLDALQEASEEPAAVLTNPVRAMESFSRPIIGAINGAAITGGFEISLACDFLIGSPHAKFRDTHCLVGVVPCWGLSQKLSRVVGPSRARLASLTAAVIDAKQAEAWGLLVAVVLDPATLRAAAVALAQQVAGPGMHQDVVRRYTQTLRDGFALPLGDALKLERARATKQYQGLGQGTIAAQVGGMLRSKL
jgi:enoyl-CoA hydratase